MRDVRDVGEERAGVTDAPGGGSKQVYIRLSSRVILWEQEVN
jgi:hypothetical protein